MRYLLLPWVVMVLGAGCSGPGTTPEEIALREPILFQADARFGRIGEVDVSWEPGTYQVVLTPSALFVTGAGYTQLIPYQRMDAVGVRPLPVWKSWPFGERTLGPARPVVAAATAHCWAGCVFELASAELNQRFVGLVSGQREQLDPFNRSDGPREFWLVVRDTVGFHGWSAESSLDSAIRQQSAAMMDALFSKHSDAAVEAFNDQLLRRLRPPEQSGGAPLRVWNPRIRLGAPAEVEAHYFAHMEPYRSDFRRARREPLPWDPAVNSSLLASITHIDFTEHTAHDRSVGIRVSFHVDLAFLDVALMTTGRSVSLVHTAEHAVPAWATDGPNLVVVEARAAADRAAERVIGLLERPRS